MNRKKIPLSLITFTDSFNTYLSLPGKSLSSFHRELCALKNDRHYVSEKTIRRWHSGESVPRKTLFSASDLLELYRNTVSDSFSGRSQIMLDSMISFLENTLAYDLTDIRRAAEADHENALAMLLDTLSFTAMMNMLEGRSPQVTDVPDLPDAPDSPDSPDSQSQSLPLPLHSEDKGRINLPVYEYGTAVIEFDPPETDFEVSYNLRYVKNGKDEFLSPYDRMPINSDIPFSRVDDTGRLRALVTDVPVKLGFQFKCFARCSADRTEELLDIMREHIDYSEACFPVTGRCSYYSKKEDAELPLIDISASEKDTVWFVLPYYRVYVTFDPFINNYSI